MGVLYVLDEPSIGLHPRDNRKLIDTLLRCATSGTRSSSSSTTRRRSARPTASSTSAPAPGIHGGEIVGEGHAGRARAVPGSLTGKYLSRRALDRRARTPRRAGSGKTLVVVGARENNLKNIDRAVPARRLHGGDGRLGLGEVDARERHPLPGRARARFTTPTEKPGAHDADRGPRAPRQGHRHRPVADRAHAALEPGDVHERLQPDPRAHGAGRPRRAPAATSPGASRST